MTRLAGVAAAVLVLAAGGQASVWAQGGKTPTYPVVPLSVMIEAAVNPDSPGPGIWGDGAPYVNGATDGTTANLDKYGNLIVSFGRGVRFDYSLNLAGNGGAVSGLYDDSYISTLGQVPRTPLQNLGLQQSQCIKLNWQYDVTGGMLRHGFNRGFDQSVQDDTSYAVVTRNDENTWLVEPTGGVECGSYNNPDSVALVFSQVSRKGKWVVTEYGRYSLPFKLTLTGQ